jgi:hypothetical protein
MFVYAYDHFIMIIIDIRLMSQNPDPEPGYYKPYEGPIEFHKAHAARARSI